MKYNQLNIRKINLDVIDYGILSVDNKPNRKNNLAGGSRATRASSY